MRSFVYTDHEDFKRQWPAFVESLMQGFADGKAVQVDQRRKSRNNLTNRKIHALMGDIRKQAVIELDGDRIPLSCYEPDVCKAFLVRWFDLELVEMGEPLRKAGKKVVCPLNGEAVYVRPSTTEFSQKEAGKFVEWLYAWGIDRGVKFSDPAMAVYEEYKEMKEG